MNTRTKRRATGKMTAASLLVMLSVALLSTPAEAAPTALPTGTAEWSIRPSSGDDDTSAPAKSKFTETLIAGETFTDSVAVANTGTIPLTLSIYATDAFNTAGGDFSLLTRDTPPVDLGSWITTGVDTVSLDPGQETQVPFTVTVPSGALPGDHSAGIVASRLVEADSSSRTQVSIEQRVGTRMYVRVDGPLHPKLSITSLTVSYDGWLYPFYRPVAEVKYVIKNDGNMRLGGATTTKLHHPFGAELGSPKVVPLAEVLPGNSVSGTVEMSGAAALGVLFAQFDVHVTGYAGLTTAEVLPVKAEGSTIAVPWVFLGLVFFLILLLLGFFWRKRRAAVSRRDPKPVGEAADAPEGSEAGASQDAPAEAEQRTL